MKVKPITEEEIKKERDKMIKKDRTEERKERKKIRGKILNHFAMGNIDDGFRLAWENNMGDVIPKKYEQDFEKAGLSYLQPYKAQGDD